MATVTLKPYRWSNGDPVTARDVEFWFNVVRANRSEWAAYLAGAFPDNVRSFHIDSPSRFTLTLPGASGSYSYTYNELSQLTLFLQAVGTRRKPALRWAPTTAPRAAPAPFTAPSPSS